MGKLIIAFKVQENNLENLLPNEKMSEPTGIKDSLQRPVSINLVDEPSNAGDPFSIFNPHLPQVLNDRSINGSVTNDNPAEHSLIFDEGIIKGAGNNTGEIAKNVNFKFLLEEIDLWDLKGVHRWGSKNSPQVTAACGKFMNSTTVSFSSPSEKVFVDLYSSLKVQQDSGETCFWTGLNWTFTISDQQTRLALTVNSKGVVMAKVFYTLDQLLRAQTEDEKLKRVIYCILYSESPQSNYPITQHYRLQLIWSITIPP